MIDLGLHRVQRLLSATPLPWRAIHVAGTNGKGSVCAYITAMLQRYNVSDFRTLRKLPPLTHARYTSPHLIDRWDCISINGETVSEKLFSKVEHEVLRRNSDEQIGASEFELLTATAFELFTQSKVDVGVIEVGMGGRLDATNIIGQEGSRGVSDVSQTWRPPPLACGIGSIGLDHQAFLGSSVSEIAREKCGVVKAGVPVVAVLPAEREVQDVIKAMAEERQASELTFVTNKTSIRDIWLRTGGEGDSVEGLSDAAIQDRWPNGALAVSLAWTGLHRLGLLERSAAQERAALLADFGMLPTHTRWPARLEQIDISPLVDHRPDTILDGAHNAQSAKMLRSHLDEIVGANPRRTQWVLGFSSGKEVREMLRILLRRGDTVHAVEFGDVAGMPWVKPMDSQSIASDAVRVGVEDATSYGKDVHRAIQRAAANTEDGSGERIVIAGSLYLAGDVSRLLRDAVQPR